MLNTWSVVLVSAHGSRCACELLDLSDPLKKFTVDVRNAEGKTTANVEGAVEENDDGIYLRSVQALDQTLELNALLIPRNPSLNQEWEASASDKINHERYGRIKVKVEVDIKVIGISAANESTGSDVSSIRLAVNIRIKGKKRFLTVYSKKIEAEILLATADYSPLEVSIDGGESFSRLIV